MSDVKNKTQIETILAAAQMLIDADAHSLAWLLIKSASDRMGFHAITVEFSKDLTFARIPEMPGCMTCGNNYEHTWKMIIDAAVGWLRVELEDM